VSHVAVVELQSPKMTSDGAYLVWTDMSVNVSAKRGKPARPILVGATGTGLDSTMCTETGLTSVCARFAQRTSLVYFLLSFCYHVTLVRASFFSGMLSGNIHVLM
jgi:hypothetical protein